MNSKTLNQRGLFWVRYMRRWNMLVFGIATILILSSLSPIALNSKAFEINVSKSKDLIDTLSEKLSGRTNNTIKERRVVKIAENINLASILSKWETKGILPGFYVYTSFNGNVKRTKLILGLTKPIDVDDDGKNDIRVKLRIRPKVIFDPLPSFALSLKMDVNRLNDDIKYGELEVAGEISLPKIFGERRLRFGYLSEAGEEIPKSCSLSYLYIPHLLKLRKKPAGGIEFNPVSAEDSSIVILATLENPVNDTETTVGIKYDPMVRSTISWERTRKLGQWKFSISRKFPKIKETTAILFLESYGMYAGLIIEKLSSASFELELRPFSKQGGYLHYIKENLKATDIYLLVQTVNLTGTLSIRNLPSELEASWLLRPEGFVEINTYGEKTGEIAATVKNVTSLSFDPLTELNIRIGWSNISSKGLGLDIDASLYVELLDIYFYGYVVNETGYFLEIPIIENGILHLQGKASIDAYVTYNEIKDKKIGNQSQVDITVENADLYFHADDTWFGETMSGEFTVSLEAVGKVIISVLNFSAEQLPPPDENYSWYNASILINATEGYLTLNTFDIGYVYMFGHVYMKNITGRGLTNVYVASIPIYYFTPLRVMNAPNTTISIEEFYLEFFDVIPISIYDAELIEGTCEINVMMTLVDLIFVELANGSNIKHFGVRIGRKDGWGETLGLPPILPFAAFYFDHPVRYLKVHWYSYGPWEDPEWEYNESYYIEHYMDHNHILIDTANNTEKVKIILSLPNETLGLFIDNKTSVKANNFKFEWNFEPFGGLTPFMEELFSGNFTVLFQALANITLDGYLNLANVGDEIWLIIGGNYIRLDQLYGGYNISVSKGHIQIGGAKEIIINQTFSDLLAGANVTLAGDFKLDTANGTIDIWFNKSGVKISGNVNFTVRNFYLAIGENFSMSADLFMFNLGTEAEGSIEIGPTPSGSGKITLTKANIVLRNCTIVYKGPIPIPNAEPSVAILSPSDGAEVSDTITIMGNATDIDGYVVQVQVRIDGASWQNATYSDETGEWSYDLDTTTLPNGVYRIEARSFDGIDYSDIAVINVTINNLGANWRPTVEITYPSDGEKVNGTVEIRGTANDPDGDISLVQIQIDDGPWQNATGTTSWTFEWNTAGLIGKHTIRARSIDNEGEISAIDSVEVTTKIPLEAEGAITLSLVDASIDIENLIMEVEITGAVILSGENPTIRIEIDRFSLGGVGNVSVELSPDGIGVETGGTGKGVSSELDVGLDVTVPTEEGDLIVDTDLYIYGRATGPLNFYYNSTGFMLGGDFGLDGEIRVDIDEISAVVNETPIYAEVHFDLQINTSAHGTVTIRWNETGLQSIKADFDSEINGYVRIYDVSINAGDYGGDLESLIIRGNGGLSIKGNTFSVKGELSEANINNLYLRLPGQNISLSGGLSTSRYTNLSLTVNSFTDFAFSSDGSFNVRNLHLSVETDNTTASVSFGKLEFDTDSYLGFRYIANNLNISCNVTAHNIYAENIVLAFGNQTLYLPTIDFEGSFVFNLNSPLIIEQGEDWMRIVVGGNGQAELVLNSLLNVNGTELGLFGYIGLRNSNEDFTIYISNLSENPNVTVDGSAIASLQNFHFWYGSAVDIEIPALSVAFSLSTAKNVGTFSIVGVTNTNIDGSISINKRNFSISGHVWFEGDAEGNITISWNESGITYVGGYVESQATANLRFENITISYENFTLSCQILYINGSISLSLEANDTTLTLHLEPSGVIEVYKLYVRIGSYEGSRAIYGTITTNATIDITLHFSGSTATILSSNRDANIEDSVSQPMENLFRFIWRWCD